MRFPTTLLISALDPPLGRVNKASLPQQTLMELFIQGAEIAERYKDADGEFTDCTQWAEVELDAEGNVAQFDAMRESFWTYLEHSGGTVCFNAAPETMQVLSIVYFDIAGTIETKMLPRMLTTLEVQTNRLSGTFDCSSLPPSMQVINVHHNEFEADPMDGHLNVVGRSSTLPRGKLGATRYHERGPPEGERREEYRVTVLAKQSTASVEKHPGRGMKLGRKATVRAHTC